MNDGLIEIALHFAGPVYDNGVLAAQWTPRLAVRASSHRGGMLAFAARQRTPGFEEWMAANAPILNRGQQRRPTAELNLAGTIRQYPA